MIAGIEIDTQLISVFVGWLLGIISSFGIDWAKKKREEQDRLNELRRDTYIQFLSYMANSKITSLRTVEFGYQGPLIVIKLKAYGSSKISSMLKDITFFDEIKEDTMQNLEIKIKEELQSLL